MRAHVLAGAALSLVLAGPALAWKPKTHVYLAEEAMRDALDGKVTLGVVDPQTGERNADREPLSTLRTYRERDGDVYFGQNLLPRGVGELRVGMPVEVLE